MVGIFRFCRLSDEAIIFGSVGHIATHIVENRHKIMCFLTIKQILDIKVSLMGGIYGNKWFCAVYVFCIFTKKDKTWRIIYEK